MTPENDRIWRDLIEEAFRKRPGEAAVSPVFDPPATLEALLGAEHGLGVELPGELRALLLETNGVGEAMDLPDGPTEIGSLIWPVERILEDNLQFRNGLNYGQIYMPFDHLVFFADAGNGDQFAYAVLDGRVRKSDIFAWNHEDDSRKWVAPSLKIFVEWFLSGKIKT
jgi:hypothetical protein